MTTFHTQCIILKRHEKGSVACNGRIANKRLQRDQNRARQFWHNCPLINVWVARQGSYFRSGRAFGR